MTLITALEIATNYPNGDILITATQHKETDLNMGCKKTVLTTQFLFEKGFRYDSEDNLWYDHNPLRQKYGFRIGVSENKRYFHLFYGGYDNDLSKHRTEEGLKKAAFEFNKTEL